MAEFEGEELGNGEQDRCYVPRLFCKRSLYCGFRPESRRHQRIERKKRTSHGES